ncbi:MAG: hypothetical protein ACPGU6_07555 [Tenacibaculum sp.]
MSINKLDKNIANKLKGREIAPSASAWERLNAQLDTHQEKKKTNWFRYFGYAASIVLLLSVGYFSLIQKELIEVQDNIITEESLDTMKLKDVKIEELLPVEEAIVKEEKKQLITTEKPLVKKKQSSTNTIVAKVEKKPIVKENKITIEKALEFTKKEVIAEATIKEKAVPLKRVQNRNIKVNSNDLLYAVTHSPEEVEKYYAKYKINRKKILNTVEDELLKSNLKIDPETILAEVELNIEEADFQQNFMNKFKSKLSDVIVAIADRNK